MRPLFFLGNKRSGTSKLVHYLNQHPEVFVTNESDVAWFLYQIEEGVDLELCERDVAEMGAKYSIRPFARHPYDIGSAGGVHTMRATRNTTVLSDPMSVRARFEAIQHTYMLSLQNGTTESPYGPIIARTLKDNVPWKDLAYIGDKMPTQNADPVVFDWIWKRMPDAKFVHIVRDPHMVVSSMQRLGFNTWWKDDTASVLDTWTKIEEWVVQAEQTTEILHVRQEDLVANVNQEMNRIWDYLGVPTGIGYPDQRRHTASSQPVELHLNDRTLAIMERYGYA